MKIKICGITNLDDALLCESLGAHALGFVFYEKSKRYINPDDAKNIIKCLSPFTLKVGVFVNDDIITVNRVASQIQLNSVQLHGDETIEYINEIIHPVIKTFRVKNDFDFSSLYKYNGVSVLLDTFSNDAYGGTGDSFNWELIPEEWRSRIILAGGISINNIDGVRKINPAAIDLSSSLEKKLGKKDEQKVKQFFQKLNHTGVKNGDHDETKRPTGKH